MKRCTDTITEDYLDDEQKYYDYHTAPISGTSIVDEKHTGMSFYDQFLNKSDLSYLRDEKNLQGNIVQMSPEEYYELCATKIFPGQTVSGLKAQRAADKNMIKKLKTVLTVYKRKLCMPMINYADQGQEGLHRMYVIGELYGWDFKVPVLVVDYFDKNRQEKIEQAKRTQDIEDKLDKAIEAALEYKYYKADEFKDQLQWDMDRSFRNSLYIETPVKFEIKDQGNSFLIILQNIEKVVSKDDLTMKSSNTEPDDDILLDDGDEEFMKKYFGDNWKETHSDVYEKIKNEELDTDKHENCSDVRDCLTKVLDEHNHCYYQSSSMACECICEKLYYDHKVDATYEGRSIYINGKKVATIQVSKDGPNLVGMYAYRIFI